MGRGAGSRSPPDRGAASIIHQSPEIIVTAYRSHIEEVRAVRSTRERVADLLGQYPHVSDKDRREILAFMRNGRHLDIGLLTSSEKLRPKLDRFMKDHKRHFAIDFIDIVRVLAVITAALMVCWLLWELVRRASI